MTDKNESRQKRLHVSMPLKLFADVQYEANMSGLTLTDYVIDALEEKLERSRRESNEK